MNVSPSVLSQAARLAGVTFGFLLLGDPSLHAQLIDRTLAPNVANEGIAKSFAQEVGAGRGDIYTPGSSAFIISRDPFRAIRRGRQIFQRKFNVIQGAGPITQNGSGDMNHILAIGAGLGDSCTTCHGRPRGAAGFGGDVVTRPDSRDAPHLFGLGLKEMLADEITADLRKRRSHALASAKKDNRPVMVHLESKGIDFGKLTANPDGTVDTSQVSGVNPDLRVRPFLAHGGKISIREFIDGALNDEMGLQAVDPELAAAASGQRLVTPAGMILDGATDQLERPTVTTPLSDADGDGVINEIPTSVVDYLEFYLLNYFKPASYEETPATLRGRKIFERIDCARCHVPDLTIKNDRRVADLDTKFDSEKGIFNGLFSTAVPFITVKDDGTDYPSLKLPQHGEFVVRNIFTDFKRHDLGNNFHERNYDGTTQNVFMTTPLWGVGTTAPYGHDGRSINLTEVILRHGGEASAEAARFAALPDDSRSQLLEFLQSLVLFPPDDTASSLNPGNRSDPNYPQSGHGSIKLTVLFNDPTDPE